jgi:hypothetical protein
MTDASAAVIPIEPAAAPPVDGLSNRAVADVIGVGETTVRRHLAENSAPEDENTNEDSSGDDETAENSAPADPVEEMPPIEELAGTGANAPSHEPVTPAAYRAMPEIEYPVGPVRQAVLDHFLDSDSPEQSMAQIKAGLSTVLPGTVEAAVRREWEQGRLLRVAPGTYKLAPARPVEQSKPAPQPPPTPTEESTWLARLDAWATDPSSWDVEAFGPLPNVPNNIPPEIKAKFSDRLRKRRERYREAESAAAKRTAADAELRGQLIHATGGNFQPGPGIDDVSPIRAALELVPLDRILSAIRSKTDRKMFPGNAAATSWREDRLLREIAESYFRSIIQPRLVDAWSKAGRAPAPTAQSLPAGDMPDIDELRSLHDSPSAPPGPHSLAADAAPDMSREAAGASEAPGATTQAPEAEIASTVSPENGSVASDDNPGEPDSMPAALTAATPAEPTRSSILAAFNRNRTPPQPVPPQPTRPAPP